MHGSKVLNVGVRKAKKRRVRVGNERKALMSWIAAHSHGKHIGSEQRAQAMKDGKPLPAMQCHDCPKTQSWPVGYQWPMSDGKEQSYECGLHRQSKFFLAHLPSSRSFVGFKDRALVYG